MNQHTPFENVITVNYFTGDNTIRLIGGRVIEAPTMSSFPNISLHRDWAEKIPDGKIVTDYMIYLSKWNYWEHLKVEATETTVDTPLLDKPTRSIRTIIGNWFKSKQD